MGAFRPKGTGGWGNLTTAKQAKRGRKKANKKYGDKYGAPLKMFKGTPPRGMKSGPTAKRKKR